MSHDIVNAIPPYVLLGLSILGGYYAGLAARLVRLPSIIGYMLLGTILGPSLLGLFDEAAIDRFGFITELALGFVAFSIGSELSINSLRRQGGGIISIIFAESFGAFLAVLTAVYALTRDFPMALIFGAMAPASAPAGTVAVIQENHAKGSLTKALYAVVGFDDGLAIIIFGFAAALARSILVSEATGEASHILPAMWTPLREVLLSLFVGGVTGIVFSLLVGAKKNSRDIFIILFGTVSLVIGFSLWWHLSLILTNMAVGFALANVRREATVRKIAAPLLDIMPLVFVLFFLIAGTNLKIGALPTLGSLGLVYIAGRTTGLIGGARIGALVGHVEEKVKKYIGLGILSQAGVAIGLALIVKKEFGELADQFNSDHALKIGAATLVTVTATSVFFEIIGPICTKIALHKAGEIPTPRQT